MKPARNATGILPAISAPLRRVEAGELACRRAGRARDRAARRPAGRSSRARDQRHASQPTIGHGHGQADQRQQPREQVEAVLRRRRQHRLAELGRRARPRSATSSARPRSACAMNIFMFCAIARVRLVERRAADRAHDLALQLVLGRVLLARKRRPPARAAPPRARGGAPLSCRPQRRRSDMRDRCPRSRAGRASRPSRSSRAGRSRTSSAGAARRSGRAPCRRRRRPTGYDDPVLL